MVPIKDIARDSDGSLPTHAWPGGYPMFYVTKQNHVLCPVCANEHDGDAESILNEVDPITVFSINWEDPDLFCDECSQRIESAYAEDKVE